MSKQSKRLQEELIAKVKLFEEADSIEIGNKVRILKDDVLISNKTLFKINSNAITGIAHRLKTYVLSLLYTIVIFSYVIRTLIIIGCVQIMKYI